MADDNSNTNTENLVDMENLDKFEETFFKKEPSGATVHVPEEKVESNEVEEVPETEDDSLATDDDTDAPEGDDEPDEDEVTDEGDDEPEEQPKPKKGKKSYQERINELTAKAREAERREADTNRRLQEIEARSTKEVRNEPEPVPLRNQLPPEAPAPDAVDDKGEPVYLLGEFDPEFIRDLTKFTIQHESAVERARIQQETVANEISAAQQQLANSWAKRVKTVETEVPEIRENIAALADTFQDIDPSYGEYLASTIMENERGPEIMNYLSQNIGEAQEIVASGPRAATLAIGRLEYMLKQDDASTEERRDESRVSKAPPPPTSASKGRGSRTVVRPDTDDLDAFEKVFFNK